MQDEMDRFPIKKFGINHIDIHNSWTCSLVASPTLVALLFVYQNDIDT